MERRNRLSIALLVAVQVFITGPALPDEEPVLVITSDAEDNSGSIGEGAGSFDLSPDGKRILIGFTPRPSVWDIETGVKLFEIQPGNNLGSMIPRVENVRFSDDGSLCIAMGTPTFVSVFDAATGRHIRTFHSQSTQTPVFNRATAAIFGAAVSPGNKRLFASDETGKSVLWDIGTGEVVFENSGADGFGQAFSIAFLDQNRIVHGYGDTKLIDLDSKKITLEIEDGIHPSLTHDKKRMLLFKDGKIHLWDTESETLVREYSYQNVVAPPCLDLSDDGGFFIVGALNKRNGDGFAGSIRSVYSIETGLALREYPFEPGNPYSIDRERMDTQVAITPDGKKYVTTGVDAVRIYDISDLETAVPDATLHRQ